MSYIDELLDKNLEAKQREAAEQQIQQQQQQAEQPNEHQFINDDLFFKGAVASQTKQQAEQLSPPPPYVPGEPYWESFKQKEEPKAPDEKEFKNSMRVASIAQALAIMGDAFAAGKGANVKERKDTALEPVAKRQMKLRDAYEQRLERYKEAGDAARAQDAAMKEAWRQREYQRELSDYQLKEQRLYDENLQKENREYQEKLQKENREYQEKLQKENREYQEELQKEILAQDLNIYKQKTDYQVKKGAGGGRQQKIEYTPAQRVEISKEFRKIPFEFIAQYTTIPTRKVKKPNPMLPSQTIEEEEQIYPDKLDYGDMLEIILRYDESKEKTTTTPPPASNEYTSPLAPALRGRIKIKGF